MKFKKIVKINLLRLKKHSPEILVVAGVVGTVGSAVMACVATSKLPEVLDDCAEKKEELLKAFEEGEEVGYTENEYKKDKNSVLSVSAAIKNLSPSTLTTCKFFLGESARVSSTSINPFLPECPLTVVFLYTATAINKNPIIANV